MADSYSTILGLRLQETGANAGTWGAFANQAVFQLIEDAVAGLVSVSSNGGTYTLTNTQGGTNEAREAFLVVAGNLSVALNIVPPSVSKWYLVQNNTTSAFPVNFVVGTSISIPQDGSIYLVTSDGKRGRFANVVSASYAASASFAASARSLTSAGNLSSRAFALLMG